jgi:surface antigen
MSATLLQEADASLANGCRSYRQTVVMGSETLRGAIVACPQPGGAWTLLKSATAP